MIAVDEFAYRMQLFLYTTKRRKLAYLQQTYQNKEYRLWLSQYLEHEYYNEIVRHPRKTESSAAKDAIAAALQSGESVGVNLNQTSQVAEGPQPPEHRRGDSGPLSVGQPTR
eukprot:SAG31_NODE_5996_length_2222_cov_0.963731_1_plen_111_part_10